MPKLLLLLSCWFIALGSICQSTPTGFPDTPTITENSVGKARFGMSVDELEALYKGCTFEAVSMAQYSGEKEKRLRLTGLCVRYRGTKLFAVDTWGSGRTIRNIIVLADRYETAEGIHVGSTARKLKKALPGLRVAHASWNHDLQIVVAEDHWVPTAYWFKNAEKLADYKEVNPSGETEENLMPLRASSAVISMIAVYSPPL